MNTAKNLLIIVFIFVLCAKTNAQVITIDDTRNADDLIKNTLVNSSCASASNATGQGDIYRPGQQSFAYFNRNGSSFPFEEGIVLVTSTAQTAVGPYASVVNEGADDSPLWGRDNDLDETLGIKSLNTTILEFDFIAYTSSLSFNYIFASNEYQYNFPCEYSDGFAFLIKEVGTTDPYKNLAVLPKTSIPVSSVNIHPKIEPGTSVGGIPYVGCAASNENYFNGFNTNTSPINYAGQTVIMTAEGTVTTGKKYHVKLVIGDADVRYQNSAIFLEAGSFASKIVLGEDRTIAANNPVCFGENITLDTKLAPADFTFKWFKKSDPTITLGTNSTFEVVEAATYKVEATVNGTGCILSGEIKIDYAPEILSTNTSLLQCDDDTDGVSIFNLNKVDNIVKNNSTIILNKGYFETLANVEAKTNAIISPEKYVNKSPDQIVFARLENQYGCYKIAEVTLKISNAVIPDQNPIETCDADETQDGLYQFDLNSEVTPQLTSGLPSGLTANYYLTATDAITENNALPNIFKNTTPSSQTIYARVVNGPDCYDIAPVTLVVNTFDPPNFEAETKYLCKGASLDLIVANTFSTYLWNVPTNNTSNTITVSEPGNYSVKVTNEKDCPKTKNFTVILVEPAVLTGAEIKDFSANENSVLLQYTGTGNYEFSLDGTFFQDQPLFEKVNPGIYNAIARSKDGCGYSNFYVVYVLDYPRFFTPNGDGFNDLWYIKNLENFPDYTISIFDRYGKLLKQMNQNSPGWNGQFNGQPLISDDYWFNLLFVNGKNVKGHFSLKR